MQEARAKGAAPEPSKRSPSMPATDDEIREKYLERAIRELNQMTHELQECPHCPRGKLMPVLGSGHPQADVFMLKHAPGVAEIEEGVAFYGRAGNALMKSFKRLGIDPLVVYGTLCVKCPIAEPDLAAEACVRRVVEELAIVQPKIVVVMGEPALRVLNGLEIPSRARSSRVKARSRPSPRPSTPSTRRTSTSRWTKRTPSSASGARSRRSGSGTRTCRRTSSGREQARRPVSLASGPRPSIGNRRVI